jgi:TRAP-type transport system periplasmic protein
MKISRTAVFNISLALIFILAIGLFAACSTPAPVTSITTQTTTATTTVASTATATTTATTTVIALTLNVAPGGMIAPPVQGQFGWADMLKLIEQRTNGQIKFNVYWGQTLISQNQIATGLQSGLVDMGVPLPHFEPAKMPLAIISQKPGFGSNQWVQASAYSDLIMQDPIKTEYAKFNSKPIGVITSSNAYVLTKKPVRTLADLKGVKLAASGTQATIMSALGAVPIALGGGEQYDALSKGVVDGSCAPIDAIQSFKFNELAKNYTLLNLGNRVYGVAINIDVWNKLSPANQKVITDLAPEFVKVAYVEYKGFFDKAMTWFQSQGGEIINLSQADLDTVSKVQADDVSKWATDLDKNGQPGTQVLNDYKALIAKYEKLNPYK